MLHLVETLRELQVCEGAGNARKTRGNSTCLSLEPCCLNPALCRWPLLPCLLLYQPLLCISAPKRQKEETKITCKCMCAHLSLVCFWQFSSFTYRTRQKDVPNLSYHESRHQALPGGRHQEDTWIKLSAPVATSLSAALLPHSRHPARQPAKLHCPGHCVMCWQTLTITFRLKSEPAMRTFFG